MPGTRDCEAALPGDCVIHEVGGARGEPASRFPFVSRRVERTWHRPAAGRRRQDDPLELGTRGVHGHDPHRVLPGRAVERHHRDVGTESLERFRLGRSRCRGPQCLVTWPLVAAAPAGPAPGGAEGHEPYDDAGQAGKGNRAKQQGFGRQVPKSKCKQAPPGRLPAHNGSLSTAVAIGPGSQRDPYVTLRQVREGFDLTQGAGPG